ncbi:MAG: electron transfer flavoprotein subunit alpha/FixB family protein [Bacteroidia bacterium]|nr:electron transfer flavoprotein subunit alpha/FixB family protein [Bacteroidia bacterium]
MSVLVLLDLKNGQLKKSSMELATLGRNISEKTGLPLTGAFFSETGPEANIFSGTGITKITRIIGLDSLKSPDFLLLHALNEFIQKNGVKIVLFSFDNLGKSLAPGLAAKMDAAFASGISQVEEISGNTWVVKKNIFSGKAFARYELQGEKIVISLIPNSIEPITVNSTAELSEFQPSPKVCGFQIKEIKKLSEGNMVPLPEAERVVSGGRGLKGPENWYLVEELAKELNATTACSRPVADMHWRPHHEHVGQTGITIRPNLYIAIGISGAIQHLAGVNGSKTIVVINNDKEAPFFKSADYGVVGDAFTVVPKFIDAIRKWKAQHQ